jgi:hypothetical protein
MKFAAGRFELKLGERSRLVDTGSGKLFDPQPRQPLPGILNLGQARIGGLPAGIAAPFLLRHWCSIGYYPD